MYQLNNWKYRIKNILSQHIFQLNFIYSFCSVIVLICFISTECQIVVDNSDGSNINDDRNSVNNNLDPNSVLWNQNNLFYSDIPKFTNFGNHSSFLNYLIITPKLIQPNSIFRVIVHTILPKNEQFEQEVHLNMQILKDGVNVGASSKVLIVGQMDSAELQIPKEIKNGTYKIQVDGNYPNSVGGSIFHHESSLIYSEKFLTILIQSNRYIYNAASTVRFRCILLQRNLRSYGHPVTIYILDPRRIIMRKWPSVSPKFGVIELSYELPNYPTLGYWIIKVEAGPQIQEKKFRVDIYFPHLYEVMVTLPPFILATQQNLTATISPFYGSEKGVVGNGTVKVWGKTKENIDWILCLTEYFLVDQSYEISWELKKLIHILSFENFNPTNLIIKVEANVTDFLVGEVRSGYAETRVIHQTMKLQFVNVIPPIFKPGLPFLTHLQVSYSDNQNVPSELLETSTIRIHAEVYLENGGRIDVHILHLTSPIIQQNDGMDYSSTNTFQPETLPTYFFVESESYHQINYKSRFEEYVKHGLVSVKFKVPARTNYIILKAEYSDATGNIVSTQKRANPFISFSRKYINVICTKRFINVGEYAILQFSSTFFIDSFHYIVINKGLILQHGSLKMDNAWTSSKSFSIPVSSKMLPGFQIVVYNIRPNGEVLSDSIFIPVQGFSRAKPRMLLNERKDFSKDSIEIGFLGDPGCYVGISVQRSIRYNLQTGEELRKASVLQSLYDMEPFNSQINQIRSRDRNGQVTDTILYLQTSSSAMDSSQVFQNSLLDFSINSGFTMSTSKGRCENKEECGIHNCFYFMDKCGKFQHCYEQSVNFDCELSDMELIEYRINRTNPIYDFYDPIPEGDWAWTNTNIGPNGYIYVKLAVPKITDSWYLTAFAMSPVYGFSLMEPIIFYDSTRPFMMTLDAPSKIKRGEQVGIQAILLNNLDKDIFATVILHSSPDYKYIKLGHDSDGNVDEGVLHFEEGEHHHVVWIPAGKQLEVRIPVKSTVEQGTFEVKISAITQIRSDTSSVEITVEPEGGSVGKHTSLMLDLKNRALVLKFLNIFTEESPLNPRDPVRKYIYGSPTGHVTLYGDVFGPIFPNIPVTMDDLLGKVGQGTSDRLFDLCVNIWSLHYLRLTKQPNIKFTKSVFASMNKLLADIINRLELDDTLHYGSLKAWDHSQPSIWLSAWALQIFMHGTFQDWENYFIVEPKIFSGISQFLIRFQNEDGSFSEIYAYEKYPLNKRMSSDYFHENSPYNISLTAHVAIGLHLAIPNLNGILKLNANLAKSRAIDYLHKHLNEIKDPFQLSIVTYCLTVADTTEKELAFSYLYAKRIQEPGFIYWSPQRIPSSEFIYENQRPFFQPKNNEYWDSYAVETTSYALLSFLVREGITPNVEQIVSWLISMKLTDGGYISSLDTALTFQALTEYSYKARLREITELSVSLELSSGGDNSVQDIKITQDNIVETFTIDITNVWGHVNVIARGSGQAVVQLDVTYGVEWDSQKDTPPTDSFELSVNEYFSTERNKTALKIQSCFRWILLDESATSGAAVLENQIPSGYSIVMSDAYKLISSGIHPTLKDVFVSEGLISWYFDYIPHEWTCFSYTVRRWYPVANLSATRQSTIYETYAIERFQNVIVRDITLQKLTICHVCGSFQCPYCPNFSGSQNLLIFSYMFTHKYIFYILVLFIIFSNNGNLQF